MLIFSGALLASGVEMVEALTIVLAVGVTRGWRAALIGVFAGLVALAIVVGALGASVVLVYALRPRAHVAVAATPEATAP